MTKPNGRVRGGQVKHPGGRAPAIAAQLRKGPATIRQLIEATGYARSSVENALTDLRFRGDPSLANLRKLRTGPVKGETRDERANVEREAARLELARAAMSHVVEAALATRSLLEQAWGAS